MKIEVVKSLKHTLRDIEVYSMMLVESVVEIYFRQFHRFWIQIRTQESKFEIRIRLSNLKNVVNNRFAQVQRGADPGVHVL